jgi:hypothetical protein
MRYHLIDNGRITNTIEADSISAASAACPSGATLLPADAGGQIGDLWDGEVFTAPPPAAAAKRITRLAFRNRFTAAERIALYTAAANNAMLRAYLDDVGAATYIDLSASSTIEGVQALEAAAIIGAGRAAEILTNPVREDEAWAG